MKKNYFSFWSSAVMAMFGLLVVSCQKMSDDINLNDRKKISHFVSRESAFKKVERFFADRATRADYSLSVEDYLFYRSKSDTRSDVASDACFHVFNFADNGGFAIVAADDRATDIYAYAMEGHIDFDEAMEHTGFSVFMDGAVELYNQEVGGNSIGPDSLLKRPPFEEIGQIPDDYRIDTMDVVTVSQVPELMLTRWSQNSPYNKYCFAPDGSQAPAGCGPIAIAQIMAYYCSPSLALNFIRLDWDEILSKAYVDKNDIYADNVGLFIREIGRVADTDYGIGGASTFTSKIKPTFEYFGYECDDKQNLDDQLLMSSLNNEHPAFIGGWPDEGTGHFWVIDGYIYQTQRLEYYYLYRNLSEPFKCEYINNIYYHCNWGWGGFENGYFLSGAFNAYNNRVCMFTNIKLADL